MSKDQTVSALVQRYERLLAERSRQLVARSRLEFRISISRLLVFVAGVIAAWLTIQEQAFSPWWLLLPAAGFVALVVVHDRCLRYKQEAQRSLLYFEDGLRRLRGEWRGRGVRGEGYRDAHHLYAEDLDLFGEGSLFELLCRARTMLGERTLASWLLAPAPLGEVGKRQEAVRELAAAEELRERLAVAGDLVRSELDADRLLGWLRREPSLNAGWAWVFGLLSVANTGVVVGAFFGLPAAALYAVFLVDVLFFARVRRAVAAAIAGLERTERDFHLLAQLAGVVTSERYESAWLRERVGNLGGKEARQETDQARRSTERSAAAEIGRLCRLVERLESRRNPFFAPFALLVWWTAQHALAIERWRRRSGQRAATWLLELAEIEAAASLATFAAENPDAVYPEVQEASDLAGSAVVLDGRDLGHVLLDADKCVRNDILIREPQRGLLISGSNMSGKSTFLRACGLAVVMAQTGAPVRARALLMAPLALGASIRIVDSLLDGSSKFYAEIKRLRALLDAGDRAARGETPRLFFLLDEILHGTNSHDRRIGAEGVIKALLERPSIGLITTHDLALAEIAERGDVALRNVHFVDTVEDGAMRFDYKLHEGVVSRSNALELMRQVGLQV